MLLIRKSEEKIALGRKMGNIGGPVHLAAGQEAIPVGISRNLTRGDSVFSAHRSHAHLLALTKSPYRLFAEVLGKSTGHSKGFGGSMHLWAGEFGFSGSVPIVAGTVPLALGAALAAKFKEKNGIAITYFGDGAMEEGVVHESLNLAAKLALPVLFICENNFFSSHMHISQRQPSIFNSRFAQANLMDFELVDGNNFVDMFNVAREAVDGIRRHGKPFFLEAFTYRLYGHVDWREDLDVGINRSSEDLNTWRKRDPILRMKRKILNLELMSSQEIESLERVVSVQVEEDWNRALMDESPTPDQLHKYVYKNSEE
jgi:pyruvate dehydrogenase E1 component alpha subunit